MDRISLTLAAIASVLILCQWFVFISLRRFFFERYRHVSRRTAYLVLLGLGIINVVSVRLVFDADAIAPDTLAKQLISVSYFSFLGFVLLMSLFFGCLWSAYRLLNLKDFALRIVCGLRNQANSLRDETGALSSVCINVHRQKALCDGNDSEAGVTSHCADLPAPSRRAFLKWSAASGFAVATSAAGFGIAEGYERPVLEEFDLFHDMLDRASRPLTIIQITDFHYGLFLGSPELEKLVEKVNSIEGDALFITGDVFHSPMTPVERATPILAGLRPRRFGNFAVMGNHDFYAGESRAVNSFTQSGLTLLRNQWVTVQDGGSEIYIGGIDDPMVNWVWGSEFPGFARFMKKVPGSKGMRILLSHRPAIFPHASRAGIDLVLAGHIHGGQIIVPAPGRKRGISLANLVSPYTHGWYSDKAGRMYLNRGTGMTFIPWRINCPPEIAIFHLRRPQAHAASGEVARVARVRL
ncbi:MAG TPA: metallophosphoesterase [Desulfomonilaceae bacterium]|nr:metallophosphoesterase [Desulfomonilaceae bacterium]